jgi:DNA modification methylase
MTALLPLRAPGHPVNVPALRKRRQPMRQREGTPVKDYSSIIAIDKYVVPKKQAAKRHYGSHQYFTKRAWNVIQEYIDRFTNKGDVVCDPYGGSGVTIVEALIMGRKGIYLDISPWATFLAKQTAISPVNLGDLDDAIVSLEKKCAKKINAWWKMPIDEVEAQPLTRWYPKDAPLPKNADVRFVDELFTHRQLLALSELFHHINRIKDPIIRDLMRYAFSATLYKCNRTFISASNRAESRGGSSIFSIYRYKVAKKVIELNPWEVFERACKKLIAAKKETNLFVPEDPEWKNSRFITGQAQQLTKHVQRESVDYIFTDPPYGAHIAYLDLIRMWDAWLGFETKPEARAAEAIEGGDLGHSAEHYKQALSEGIKQMFDVLKWDRWMSLVFAHREPALWHTIVSAAEAAGFEYVNTVGQPVSVVWSMHKKKNPLTVLSGELIINFRKRKNPKTLAISAVGIDAVNLIKNSAELSIVQNDGATTEQIYSDLIPGLLEHGLLGDVSEKMQDITPLLRETFVYDDDSKLWNVVPGTKLGCHIPLDLRIKFYVTDYLNSAARIGEKATIDRIVMKVLPKLKNGEQPTKQRLMSEIKKIAIPVEGEYWVYREDPQSVFEFAVPDVAPAMISEQIRRAEEDYEHNEILHMLAKLGHSAGLATYVGKKEQSASWNGERFADMSAKNLPFLRGAEQFAKSKVEQIDLIWLDAKRPAVAFEVEHSTSITSALDRFLELLKVDNKVAERLFIVTPKSRQRKLNQILSSSHYIGAPMYLETKVRYLWYSDVVQMVERFRREQATKAKAIGAALHMGHPAKARPR